MELTMNKTDHIRIRPLFSFDKEDGKILPPKLCIEVNGEVVALRSSIEIDGRILDSLTRSPEVEVDRKAG